MNLNDEGEVGRIHLGERLVAKDTGIVDENVNAAPGFLGLRDHLYHLLIFGHAGAVRHRFPTGSLDFFDHLVRGVRCPGAGAITAQVVHHDLGAATGQLKRIFATKAAASASDNGYLVVETDGHGKGAPSRELERLPILDIQTGATARFVTMTRSDRHLPPR